MFTGLFHIRRKDFPKKMIMKKKKTMSDLQQVCIKHVPMGKLRWLHKLKSITLWSDNKMNFLGHGEK